MERWSVATSEILFRVFLFHFEKISSHFNIFRNVLVNLKRKKKKKKLTIWFIYH